MFDFCTIFKIQISGTTKAGGLKIFDNLIYQNFKKLGRAEADSVRLEYFYNPFHQK